VLVDMCFIDDMKIGRKLLSGFLVVVLILAVVAVIGYMNLQTVAGNQDDLYRNHMQPAENLAKSNAALEKMRGDLYRYVYFPSDRPATKASYDAQIALINDQMDECSKSNLQADEKENLAKFRDSFALMQASYAQIMKDADANNMKAVEAGFAANGDAVRVWSATLEKMDQARDTLFSTAADLDKNTDESVAGSGMVMIIATLAGIIISIAIALSLSRSITDPIERIKQGIKDIHQGRFLNRVSMNRKDEMGEIGDTLDKFAADFQKYILGTMVMIADGDFSRNLKPRDDKDEMVPPVKKVIETLRAVNEESNKLSRAAVEGKLSVRGNADQFKGGYWEIIAGLNKTMENVILPLNEAMRVSEQYANGDFTARFNDKIKVNGDFKKFRDEMNEIGEKVSKSLVIINQQVGDLAASAEEANASVEEVSAGSA